ncbi:hypothetical protein [Paenibacillus sp. MMS20-IR301]|uniref:hypothetical protein n=1 Tax=Paenibacillus sp. MMS20-IR301 TaxID=2895946 RepID=UPI0028F141B7|nr:hypothetical protein [Paenibacillus sp. MMS20-IR301]WNS45934.1 hypothetical protein LOS79_11880 [Paenibacillus sp. MMS20-IR301]
MRQLFYGGIAVLVLAGIIIYGFLSAPKVIRLDREFELTAYKLKNADYAEPVTVALKGAFAEKSNAYTGELKVNGLQYEYCNLSPDAGVMICVLKGSSGEISSLGLVYADSDYEEWSLAVQKGETAPDYKSNSFYSSIDGEDDAGDDSLILSYPAKDRKTALQQYENLRRGWLEKQGDLQEYP